jgi:hypothetical protein
VSSLAVGPDSWVVRRPRRHLPNPYNITMPRILALAWVSCEPEVLLTVVRLVLSIVVCFVLVVCDPHECSLGVSFDPGSKLPPISRQDCRYSFVPGRATALYSQHAASLSTSEQMIGLDPCVASSKRQRHPDFRRRLPQRQPRLSRQCDEQQSATI